ncbi:hypothetical protein A2U01_0119574 [Trifolium medium]|uniref:Uncharacterized protein n=1 Tax=Trifolium medium TaxID=97028 RepID=A0A392WJD5_9FABA|nr:hypothetical protein [Trifolium medium]
MRKLWNNQELEERDLEE